MAFPTSQNIIINIFASVIGILIVHLLFKVLKSRPKPPKLADRRNEAALSFLVFVVVFVMLFAWTAFRRYVLVYSSPPPWDGNHVLLFTFFYAMLLLPMIIAMRRTGQSLGSIGINEKESRRMITMGITLGAVIMIIYGFAAPFLGGSLAELSPSLFFGFVAFAINSSSEEAVFRGYIQTRLTAYWGTFKGLAVTSLLFAVWHFPVTYFQFSGAVLEALAWASTRLFPGLIMGYIMLRSQSIIPCSIFHLFWNWNLLLWQISLS